MKKVLGLVFCLVSSFACAMDKGLPVVDESFPLREQVLRRLQQLAAERQLQQADADSDSDSDGLSGRKVVRNSAFHYDANGELIND